MTPQTAFLSAKPGWPDEAGVTRISGMVIPQSFGLRRDAPPRGKILSDAFWQNYDCTTLFYMAMHDSATAKLHLIAPPLMNFAALIPRAQFFVDGQKLAPPRLRHGEKFDHLVFDAAPKGVTLSMVLDGTEAEMPVHVCDPVRFAGRRVLYTLSKNNDLAWISDWMLWHQRKHKADAVLFVDNDSTSYGPDALRATLGAVEGYDTTMLVQVPLRYGPGAANSTKQSDGEFLQTALMNAFWLLSLRYARAILNVDVDELIVSAKGEAIFDAVENARYGIVMATGQWRYARPGIADVRHRDHTRTLPNDSSCPPKYCLRPDGFAARQQLKVHGVSNFKRVPFVNRHDFSFLHCRAISNSWNYTRGNEDASTMVEDGATRAMLNSVFPDAVAA